MIYALIYPRSSAVFGVFLVIGTFIFASIRAYYKPLVFMSVFGTIAIDIFCVRGRHVYPFFFLTPPKAIGPLFPFTQFTLLNGLLIPVSMYAAIAIVVTIFVFPRTAHSAFLGTVTQLLSKMELLLDAQEDLLVAVPGSINPGSPKALQLRALRVSMFTIHQGRTFFNIDLCYQMWLNHGSSKVTLQGKFINAEFSWGRWNGDDARRLQEPLFSVISRISKWCSTPFITDSYSSRWPNELRQICRSQRIQSHCARL